VLKLRILTALVLIPLFISAVLYLNSTGFSVLMASIMAMAAWEWALISGYKNIQIRVAYVLLVLFILLLAFIFHSIYLFYLLTAVALVWWAFALNLVFRYQKYENIEFLKPQINLIIGLFVLIPACVSAVVLHAYEPDAVNIVLFLFVLIWSADIAAYFSGRRWGQRKLCNKVSPGKSWEGVYGALASSVLMALIYAKYSHWQGVELLIFMSICIITVLASILGDLLESLMKRTNNVKDSGSILPGHGGVLDRIDSLTAALPIFLSCFWLWETMR
jgi:phosphatidate cytidylyltransferase